MSHLCSKECGKYVLAIYQATRHATAETAMKVHIFRVQCALILKICTETIVFQRWSEVGVQTDAVEKVQTQ